MKVTTAKAASTTDRKVLLLGSFANDATADASVSGSAAAGSVYYNTTTGKMKVKEVSTWKTVTTF